MLYHVTHRGNLRSIMEKGLLTSYAQSKAKRVWLLEYEKLLWAEGHVCLRHKCSPSDLVALRVSEARIKPKSSGREGLYYVDEDVPVSEIESCFEIMLCPVAVPGEAYDSLHTS